MAIRNVGTVGCARLFANQPERVAAAWRRVRYAGDPRQSLLEGLVESFIREVGMSLAGASGSAWSRTQGMLRVSHERGARGIYDEFNALRRCLLDALAALGAEQEVRTRVSQSVDEAVDSAVALGQRMLHPQSEKPAIPFGGLVVEFFERARTQVTAKQPEAKAAPSLH